MIIIMTVSRMRERESFFHSESTRTSTVMRNLFPWVFFSSFHLGWIKEFGVRRSLHRELSKRWTHSSTAESYSDLSLFFFFYHMHHFSRLLFLSRWFYLFIFLSSFFIVLHFFHDPLITFVALCFHCFHHCDFCHPTTTSIPFFSFIISHHSFSLPPPHKTLTRLTAAVQDDILTWHLLRNSNPNTTSPMVITGNIVFYCLRINKLVHQGDHKLTVLRVFFLNERPLKQPGIFLWLCHGPLNWDPSQWCFLS